MTDTIKISRDELQRIAQGCSCEVTTDALDALLATSPADAADMGGQSVYRCHKCNSVTPPPAPYTAYVKCQCGEWTSATAAMDMGGQAGEEVVAWCTPERDRVITEITKAAARADGGAMLSSVQPYSEPLMTVAKHRQQAGKLVEAVEKMLAEMALMGIDDRYRIVLDMRKAIAGWEVKHGE